MSRERWLESSQQITTALLTDPGDEDIFARIVDATMVLAAANHAALVLPGVGDTWVMEFTAGPRAADLLGLVLPETGHAIAAIRSGEGTVAAAPPGATVLEPVRDFGPTLYAPLRAADHTVGLLMLWREPGQRPFDEDDLATAQRFANQAALALRLAELSHARNMTAMLEDRERLADDLHDFVSQELFAAAMQIEAIAGDVDPAASERLLRTLDHVKRAQHEVRGVMSTLAGHRASEPFGGRVNREMVMAHDSLGFAPTMQVDWVGVDDAVMADPTLADDALAVLRELLSNVARHAHATAVHVDLGASEGRFSVVISDNGIGPGRGAQPSLRDIESRRARAQAQRQVHLGSGGTQRRTRGNARGVECRSSRATARRGR